MGLFSRMYYGNPNKPDLKDKDFTHHRFQLFFTVVQIRFWKLMQMNFMMAVCWTPVFFWLWLNLSMLTQSSAATASIIPTFFLVLIPLLMLAGPGTAGAFNVMRKWARDEHGWVWMDFKEGFKDNWKQSIIIMAIIGVILYLLYVSLLFYSSMQDNIIYLIFWGFTIVMGMLVGITAMFTFPMMTTYNLKTKHLLKNAIIFALAKFPRNLLMLVLTVALTVVFYTPSLLVPVDEVPVILGIIVMPWPYIGMTLPMMLFGFAFPSFIAISYSNWMFDLFMNKDDEKEEDETEMEQGTDI